MHFNFNSTKATEMELAVSGQHNNPMGSVFTCILTYCKFHVVNLAINHIKVNIIDTDAPAPSSHGH